MYFSSIKYARFCYLCVKISPSTHHFFQWKTIEIPIPNFQYRSLIDYHWNKDVDYVGFWVQRLVNLWLSSIPINLVVFHQKTRSNLTHLAVVYNTKTSRFIHQLVVLLQYMCRITCLGVLLNVVVKDNTPVNYSSAKYT